MTSRLITRGRMSTTCYRQNGKPNWWARIGSGNTIQWVTIPRIRADDYLNCIVDLPPGTTVHCGADKGSNKMVRETIVTIPTAGD